MGPINRTRQLALIKLFYENAMEFPVSIGNFKFDKRLFLVNLTIFRRMLTNTVSRFSSFQSLNMKQIQCSFRHFMDKRLIFLVEEVLQMGG